MLYKEIEKLLSCSVKKKYHSRFLMEVDQSCSAGVFSSLYLGIPVLGDRVNLNASYPLKQDQAYTTLMQSVVNYVKNTIDEYNAPLNFIGCKERPQFSVKFLKNIQCRELFKK
jgi:predicted transposase YdaD